MNVFLQPLSNSSEVRNLDSNHRVSTKKTSTSLFLLNYITGDHYAYIFSFFLAGLIYLHILVYVCACNDIGTVFATELDFVRRRRHWFCFWLEYRMWSPGVSVFHCTRFRFLCSCIQHHAMQWRIVGPHALRRFPDEVSKNHACVLPVSCNRLFRFSPLLP